MSKRFKRFQKGQTILERMDMSRGSLPDFLRDYWIYKWLIPWLFTLAFNLAGYIQNLAYYIWPLIYLSMIVVRFFDIYKFKGTTFLGYPASHNSFHKYIFIASIPMTIGILITAMNN